MRNLLILILSAALLAGCSSATQAASRGGLNIASVAAEGRVTEQPGPSDAQPASSTLVMTVNPTPLMLVPMQGKPLAATPTPLSRQGWQIFSSASVSAFKDAMPAVLVEYPPDWSLAEQDGVVTFTSAQGAMILLKLAVPGSSGSDETRPGNQRCASRANAYNLTADICFDNAALTSSARFSLPGAVSGEYLLLSTTSRATGPVFEAIFNSLRLAQ